MSTHRRVIPSASAEAATCSTSGESEDFPAVSRDPALLRPHGLRRFTDAVLVTEEVRETSDDGIAASRVGGAVEGTDFDSHLCEASGVGPSPLPTRYDLTVRLLPAFFGKLIGRNSEEEPPAPADPPTAPHRPPTTERPLSQDDAGSGFDGGSDGAA